VDFLPPSPAVAAANPALTLPAAPPIPGADSGPPLHRGLHPFRAVAAVLLCGVFAFLTLYSTQPLLPMLTQVLHASKAAVGLTVSASTLGVALAAPIFGALTERLSRRRVIVISAVASAIPTLLAATSPGLHTLIFWRFLQGIALPGIFATVITYIGEEWQRESIALIMSLYVSATALGGFLGRFLSGLFADTVGWRWSFVLLGGLTLLGAALIARWLPHGRRRPRFEHEEGEEGPGGLGALWIALRHLRNPRLLTTFGVGFGTLFTLVATFTYSTFYLADAPFHLSTFALSYLFAIYLVGLVVTPFGGFLVTRIGMRHGIAAAIAVCALGEVVTLSHTLWIVVLPGLGLVCTGVFIAQSTATSFLRMAAPAGGRVSAAGLYLSSYYIGGTIAGVAPSYVWSIGRWPACVALVETVLLGMLILALAGWRNVGWSTH
jgi:MFS transporter, YNFM family, putative membrane transport protein